jgi:imidazolonepropionase-like amidohydrolase
MKKIGLLLILMGVTFTSFGQIPSGINRRFKTDDMQRSSYTNQNDKKDPITTTMEFLTKELNLDAFQEAAIKSFIQENITEGEKISASSLNSEEKKVKFESLRKKLEEKTKSILKPEQIETGDEDRTIHRSKQSPHRP